MSQDQKNTYNFIGAISCIEPLTVSLKDVDGLPRNGGKEALAYFPASSIRGALRHNAHAVVQALAHHQEDGKTVFDLADHFMLAQGVDIAEKATVFKDGEVDAGKEIREANPMLSLFGRWGMGGKVGMGNALSSSEQDIGMFGGGTRGVMFERNPDLIEFLDDNEQQRLTNLLEEQSIASIDIQAIKADQAGIKRKLKNATEEEKKDLFAKLAQLDEAIKKRKEEKSEAKESIRRPIDRYEAFNAGTKLTHRMTLKGVTDIELGLFIASVLQFARNPVLGGHQGHNCGLVSASWEVRCWPKEGFKTEVIGKVGFDDDGFVVEGELLENAYNAWKQATGLDFKRF